MIINRKHHVLAAMLALFFGGCLYLPCASAGTLSGTQWTVTSGDTLYAISRAIYPGDASKRGRLRRDIIKLNPSIFVEGANNIGVGTVLTLPDYVAPKSAPSKASRSTPLPVPILMPPENNAPKPAPTEEVEPVSVPQPEKVIPKPVQQPQPVPPVPVVKPQPKMPKTRIQSASTASRAEGDAVVNLGFSYGGEKIVDVGGGPDIFAGNGAQLRLGYEQMFQQGSGYRASLGFQYYTLFNQRDVSYRDTYLQLAYQYRVNPLMYGVGIVVDTGATLKTSTTTEFNSAIGAIVYLEYVGSGQLEGWGLSVTTLDIEEKNSGASVGASRAEVYYSWRY